MTSSCDVLQLASTPDDLSICGNSTATTEIDTSSHTLSLPDALPIATTIRSRAAKAKRPPPRDGRSAFRERGRPGSLHLRFLEDDVLARHRDVLLPLQFLGHAARVLLVHVEIVGVRGAHHLAQFPGLLRLVVCPLHETLRVFAENLAAGRPTTPG